MQARNRTTCSTTGADILPSVGPMTRTQDTAAAAASLPPPPPPPRRRVVPPPPPPRPGSKSTIIAPTSDTQIIQTQQKLDSTTENYLPREEAAISTSSATGYYVVRGICYLEGPAHEVDMSKCLICVLRLWLCYILSIVLHEQILQA
jgi:hypothetical protein